MTNLAYHWKLKSLRKSKPVGSKEGTVAAELKRIRAQDEIDSFESDQITRQLAHEFEVRDLKLAQKSSRKFSE